MSASPASEGASLAQQALERAKAIAAKLSGTVPGTDASAGTTKRRRWDEPNATDPSDDSAKRAKAAAASAANGSSVSATNGSVTLQEKRIWIATTEERPAQHYVLHLTDHLTAFNESNGIEADASNSISAKLLGKGTDEPVIPGLPQLALHILLTAPSHQQLTTAAARIQTWIDEADRAEPLNYSEQAIAVRPSLQEQARGGSGNYRPASVAQLIHGNPAASHDTPFTHEITIGVPHSVVGYIIGRGGSTLAQIQASTGVSVQIQKENELEPGQTQRQITLSAHDEQSLQDGQRQIEKLVREKCGPIAGAPGIGFTKKHLYDAKLQEAISAGHAHVTLHVPEDDVGLVIGKQGSTIRHIQETTGCHVQVMPPDSSSDEGDSGKGAAPTRAVHITHPTEHGAHEAKAMIEGILRSKPPSHGAGGTYGGSNAITVQVAIPDRDVGLCIGKQGSVIRQIQNTTNCRIQIPPQCGPGESHRIVSVTGSKEGTEMVRRMIETISAEQSSACVMSGDFNQYLLRQQQGYHAGHQLQQQADPNQQYSAEWAAYHAAQATVQQQQVIQQAPQTSQVTAAAVPAADPAPDAYYEQFFRYAYYYGEDAARQYYGAWSPPPGTPNPYGVNPALGATQPSDQRSATATVPPSVDTSSMAAAANEPPAAAAVSTQPVRDSSQRRVSNLPAWMTKS